MSFYDQSLIIGDSQMRNLGNYIRRKRNGDPGFFPGVRCYGEYSLQMRRLAQKDPDPNPDAIQLTYKGRTATLTGIAMAENPRNVFILIGLNDLIFQHIDRADNYIDRIVALRDEYFPETSLFFMSLTPVTAKRTRGILTQAVEAAKLLEEKGISAEVVSFPCVKPMDEGAVRKLTERFRHIVTVEEHNIIGGFGSAVCEIAAETGNGCRIHRIGLQDCYTSVVGNQQYLREIYGMDAKAIAEKTEAWLNEA